MLEQYADELANAPGATHNHQTWRGGYLDHVTEAMNVAVILYDALGRCRPLPLRLEDLLLAVFLHDLEKPWRSLDQSTGARRDEARCLEDPEGRMTFRLDMAKRFGIPVSDEVENAVRYAEGEGAAYDPQGRVMGPLAALCHCADTLSARLWFDRPAEQDEAWGRRWVRRTKT
jgi:hypothetical protein